MSKRLFVKRQDIFLGRGPRVDGDVAALHGVVGHGVELVGGNAGFFEAGRDAELGVEFAQQGDELDGLKVISCRSR